MGDTMLLWSQKGQFALERITRVDAAQLVKCLRHKQEDQSLDSQHLWAIRLGEVLSIQT